MRSRRVKKLLPVPLLPKTPLERCSSVRRSRQTTASMSSGVPTAKLSPPSSPKTCATSASEARAAREKCAGTVRAGAMSPAAPATLGSVRRGRTTMLP